MTGLEADNVFYSLLDLYSAFHSGVCQTGY